MNLPLTCRGAAVEYRISNVGPHKINIRDWALKERLILGFMLWPVSFPQRSEDARINLACKSPQPRAASDSLFCSIMTALQPFISILDICRQG